MRGLEKKCTRWRTQTHTHTDIRTWQLYDALKIPHTGDIESLDRCGSLDRYNFREFARFIQKKSRIQETLNLPTDAYRRMGRFTRPRVHATAPRVGNGRSAPTPRFEGSTRVIRLAPHVQ